MLNALSVLLVASLGVPGPGPSARGELLPVPTVNPGQQLTVTAVDVSPSGAVVGNAQVVTTAFDGTTSTADLAQKWAKTPRDWRLRPLSPPAGSTSTLVYGLTDRGEAAGLATLDGTTRATRWSADGRSSTLIGEARSRADAVGPDGPWGVSTAGDTFIAGEAELVTRAGVRTPLRGTPELDAGYRRNVGAVGGPDTALVWVTNGIGQGTTAAPVLWKAGATLRLPVFSSIFLGPACVSRVQPDGSVVASGFSNTGGLPKWILLRHTGGVPGTDEVLAEATQTGGQIGGLSCTSGLQSNTLAADGGIAGYLNDAEGRRNAAYWNAANVVTTVPLATGERSASGVAAATGGRMVILAESEDGTNRLSLWRNGRRTQLPAPRGWTVASVVELTEAGLLVANVRNEAGTTRPAVWNLR
ncbi:MAG: hypothetical protein ABW022_05135 [Actinoplanes sp.]